MDKIINVYKSRDKRYLNLIKKYDKSSDKISVLRFIVFIFGVIFSALFYADHKYYLLISAILCTIILFAYLVHIHNNVYSRKEYCRVLSKINEVSIDRINGKWKDFKDDGKEFIDQNHDFSYDIDIFGRGSLFQWTNEAVTYRGRQRLKELFINKPDSKNRIEKRQEAVSELSQKINFRQNLQAAGKINKKQMSDPSDFLKWAEEKSSNDVNKPLLLAAKCVPLVTFIVLVLSILGRISFYAFVVMLVVQYSVLKIKSGDREEKLYMAEKYCRDIKVYEKMIKLIEKHNFKSQYLNEFKNKLIGSKGAKASIEIKELSKIMNSIEGRRNAFYALLNYMFYLDFYQVERLEKWKKNSGKYIRGWIDTIGEFEALSSLARIKFDNPVYVFPKIEDSVSELTAVNMGHPLIGKGRVCNSISIKEPDCVLLITGSNMSGKSTLLRTAGINLVLSYAGSCVCAEKFSCTIMRIQSCMRINDNLEKNISSFYGEILKIKNIVSSSKKGEKVFFLLDEIFKGTNSRDRHTGAAILIKQLIKSGGIGLVSTHDLELGSMEDESGSKVKNYHFEEYYKDNKIMFDYKLRRGVSNTRNAIYLMKMAGIEIKDDMN